MRTILLSLALVLGLTAVVLVFALRDKQAYVDSGKLFAEFKMSKELQKQLETTQKKREGILDSLNRQMNEYSQYLQQNKNRAQQELNRLGLMQEELSYKQQIFQEDQGKLVSEYNGKIWSQINEYMKQFGKEKNYKVILGANGQGSLMYADEQTDITGEVLNYINARYDGK
ncbi:MAG: outer rane chaperone Skp (OmpH) [Bacteroidetes bacterium]|jgi:outer membrane protein|nr:outer rane chaperone Skp (OmpH) [Bacteroidota bacterium]